MDELDYFLLPESAWNKLHSWYGLSTGSKVIARKVVEYGLYMKHCKVEVYLLEFKLCVHPNLNDVNKREFSRADTVGKSILPRTPGTHTHSHHTHTTHSTAVLEQSLRELYEVDSSTECRVWHRYMTHTYELLSKTDQSLQDGGLYNGQVSR